MFSRFKGASGGLVAEIKNRYGKPLIVDIHTAGEGFRVFGFFLVILYCFAAIICIKAKVYHSIDGVLIFFGLFHIILLLWFYGMISSKRTIVSLLQFGRKSLATVTQRQVVLRPTRRPDLIRRVPKYCYHFIFKAYAINGSEKIIEALTNIWYEDRFKEGDTVPVLYSMADPRICCEEPSESMRHFLLSSELERYLRKVGLICFCIASVVLISCAQAFINEWPNHFERLRFACVLLAESIALLIYSKYSERKVEVYNK